jgi:hypothetical protein
MKRIVWVYLLVAVSIALYATFTRGAERSRSSRSAFSKPLGVPLSTMLNINRVAAWYNANGEQERIPSTGNSGLYYPRGTSTAIYSAGLIWGGKFSDGRTPAIRVNGQSYSNGTKPGAIRGFRTGDAEDPNADDVRIYRIRRDYATADLRQDAAEINQIAIASVTDAQIQAIRAQYKKDWLEWPWRKGAPYYDRNNNGVYDPDPSGAADATKDEPGIADADQVVWYVCNDIGVAQPWTCPESGMEQQATIWGYNRVDPIGNVIFKKFRLIYKGTAATPPNARIDSMYMCQWSDPDLGDFGDDFAGCDTTLSLGYVYNARPADRSYADFNLVPPASGYDFLQGPLVPGIAGQDRNRNGIDDARDNAIFDLKKRGPGFINLPMTAFIYFAANGRYSDPPFSYSGAIQWYQMLRGLPPTPQGPPDPPAVVNPVTNQPTSFWLSGDPVTNTGWIDGSLDNPGDRRIILASGPFTMALGDTQELVSAWVGGLGGDHKNSITVMKFNDRFVQTAYDSLFNLPKPPENPPVVATAINNTILLDWGTDSAALARTEKRIVIGNYRFEGYKVYQFPDPSGRNGVLLAQFDLRNGVQTIRQPVLDPITGELLILPVQYGTDNGLQRQLIIDRDAVRGRPLVNGQRYYFAVTTYNFTPDTINPFKTYESSPQVVIVVPETPRPGTRYSYAFLDTAAVRDLVGGNDANVRPIIYNPASARGDLYHLRFDSTTTATSFKWTLTNAATGKVLYANMTDFSDTMKYQVQEAGYDLRLALPPTGMRRVVDQNNADVFNFPNSDNTYRVLSITGSLDTIGGRGRTARDFEMRFDGTGSYAVSVRALTRATIRVPFSVWDLGRSSSDTPRQVIAVMADSGNTVSTWNLTPNSFVQGGRSYRIFEPIWISSIPYPTGANDSAGVAAQAVVLSQVVANISHVNNAVHRAIIANVLGNGVPPANGTKIRFVKYHEVRHGDIKVIDVGKVTSGDVALARKDVDAIKVFPNPYYGLNRAETSRERRFVTFNHLPENATIRIFNLAGVLVRTLRHPEDNSRGPGQFFDWDLQNDNGLPIASGIYIAYVELRNASGVSLGTKTLKFAIIQEQQFLRNF